VISIYPTPEIVYFRCFLLFRGDKVRQYLDYAIQLAKMVDGQTGVNPPVGTVVVKDGRIIGIGAHIKKDDKHSYEEVRVMTQIEAKGGTIFISLEPCTHFGSTPPCVNKIIDYGIEKVIYAVKDTTLPSKGDEILQSAGIEVVFCHEPEAKRLYRDFFISKREE